MSGKYSLWTSTSCLFKFSRCFQKDNGAHVLVCNSRHLVLKSWLQTTRPEFSTITLVSIFTFLDARCLKLSHRATFLPACLVSGAKLTQLDKFRSCRHGGGEVELLMIEMAILCIHV